MTKRALSVYERMCTGMNAAKINDREKKMAYELFIAKMLQYRGVEVTRPLYERAIVASEDVSAATMCI